MASGDNIVKVVTHEGSFVTKESLIKKLNPKAVIERSTDKGKQYFVSVSLDTLREVLSRLELGIPIDPLVYPAGSRNIWRNWTKEIELLGVGEETRCIWGQRCLCPEAEGDKAKCKVYPPLETQHDYESQGIKDCIILSGLMLGVAIATPLIYTIIDNIVPLVRSFLF